jgi:hypothetical protein
VALRRIDWVRAGWFIAGLILGCVVGARYLSSVNEWQFVLGLLPPYSRNVGANYRIPDAPYVKLAKGMSKGEVADLLSVGRVDVVAGDQLKDKAQGIMHGHGLRDEDFARFVEVWRIPVRAAGISEYVYLAFDKDQRLDTWGVSEFMMGFPAERRNE